VTSETLEQLDLTFGSEFPTNVNPARAQAAARAAAAALSGEPKRLGEGAEHERIEQESWCDSEAPTGVAAERPLFPPPPRAPSV
jgi:hypothetical protein